MSTLAEFVIAATDCTAKEVTDPAKCNLLAEKVSEPDPGALGHQANLIVEQSIFLQFISWG